MSVPKLRFKEFDGDWIKSKLGSEAQFFQGEQVSLDDQCSEYAHGLIKFLRIENFTQKSKDFRYIRYTGSQEKILVEQDIAIVRYGATAGFICSGETGVIANNLFKVSVDNKKINQKYLELVLKSEKTFNYFQAEMSGGAMPALNFKIVGNLDITYSSIQEQTKIASFLSNVDEKISQLNRKHELLSQYKQGMMQKLFSQQIHFKADDGSAFGAWKHCKLKDVLISYRLGGNYSNAEMVTSYPLIKMGNLGRGSINLDKIEYIPEDQIIDPKDLIKKNDLFFNTRNTLDLVGKVALWRGELPIAYYNSNLLRLDFENNIFMNYLFNEQKTLEKLKAIASGTTSVAAIYTKDLLKINLEIPCLEEQNKIASFLSSIDQKIEVVAQQIEQAKTWKKGLLQQMFV